MTRNHKKLIEVSLPLDSINDASKREKSIRHGHPSTLHLWWARRPLAAARAVIFAQMVDDPSSWPEIFPTERARRVERERLFDIIRRLVLWESTTDERVLEEARQEMRRSWRRTCSAGDGSDRRQLPPLHDPFAGGGAIPLEAQRLGLEAHASDLNPVAVMINKAMIEIPPRFAGNAAVNQDSQRRGVFGGGAQRGAAGLADDVRYYGQWMPDEAERRIGHLYPTVKITPEMVRERPDLRAYAGKQLTIIAWLWARTVKSPNPAFADVNVPLASSFMLSTKKGKQAYVRAAIHGRHYRFTARAGSPPDLGIARAGTSAGRRRAFRCLVSGEPITYEYIRAEGRSGRLGARLMAVAADGVPGRVYLSPSTKHERAIRSLPTHWRPSTPLPNNTRDFKTPLYGIRTFGELFTDRQLVALTTFSDLVAEAMREIRRDAVAAGMPDDGVPLREGGRGATAYAEAVGVYLAFVVDKVADYWSSICSWHVSGEKIRSTFSRQAIPMTWDYAEANPFSSSTGNWTAMVNWAAKAITTLPAHHGGSASQADAAGQAISRRKVVSTDPPYYDNIGYADLSDFFYVWMRRSLRGVFPEVFATMAVPKADELVATPYRHGGREQAEEFFMDGMTDAMACLARQTHPEFPVTIYYAFKQSERRAGGGVGSTGWETFLEAVIRSGLMVTGTWPMRTELTNRMLSIGTNALASSIVLVCRKRSPDAALATRREFLTALRSELPPAVRHLKAGHIAPVDLAQAAIGPGMAVYTRYASASGRRAGWRLKTCLAGRTLGPSRMSRTRCSQGVRSRFTPLGKGPLSPARDHDSRHHIPRRTLVARPTLRFGPS